MGAREVERTPELSVVVPTHARPDRIEQLLESVDRQTLAADRFELILVDDGSPEPVVVPASHAPYALRVLRQSNAGPAAARNLGTLHCRAPLVLFLNDDAVPAPDVFEQHVLAHAQEDRELAVLGAFPFSAAAREHPFVQILADSDLLFDFPGLRHGELHGWTFFWTCNLSLPVASFRAAGGFDAERFREPIVEDVELGYRLERRGLAVRYREDIVCEHEHVLDARGYFARQERLGVNLARMQQKHGDASVLRCPTGQTLAEHLATLQATCENFHASLDRLTEQLEALGTRRAEAPLPTAVLRQTRELVGRMGGVPFARGVLRELEGHDPFETLEHGPPKGRLTSILVVSHDALDKTRRCLEALRSAHEDAHPTEILFVDNGSTDGSREFLEAQPDVRLVANRENAGAPRARNQALALARGDAIVFMDNDVMVTPGWLSRLLYHLHVDGRSGCVGCLADRAAHEQELALPASLAARPDPDALARFAEQLAAERPRQCRPAGLVSSFLVMVRRELIDAIGGFDEQFSPWGFEDDDFSLRAALAGFRNRVALDVFVRHEAYANQTKSERHARILGRNWQRFSDKWQLARAYGDLSGLDRLRRLEHPREKLHVAFEPGGTLQHAARESA